MSENVRYYVKNVGKRRKKRGINSPKDGKKTWYVTFVNTEGQKFMGDTSFLWAMYWRIRAKLSPYSLELPETEEIS